jgi:hypothetical protein
MIEAILSILGVVAKPLFDWLNARVDADKQIHIVDAKTMGAIATGTLGNLANADNLNAQIRMKEGNWGPTVIMMAVILAPFVWHEWQVVLDSSRFLIGLDWSGTIPLPHLVQHRPGSWGVPSIGKPGPDGQSAWDKTEQAIFTSFFVGATTAVAGAALIKAFKK